MARKPSQKDREAGEAKYEEFHRYPPTKIGEFASGFSIPSHVFVGGRGKWVTYRSGKVDPATLKKPRRPVDYIHEFEAGVVCYLTKASDAKRIDARERTVVPAKFRDVTTLTKLGESLGLCFDMDGDEVEIQNTAPLPELYAVPDGSCLLVVQSKKTITAMVWGGGLTVKARGIDG